MLFSSLVFLFTFLPITLLVYYLVPRKVKNVVLLFHIKMPLSRMDNFFVVKSVQGLRHDHCGVS